MLAGSYNTPATAAGISVSGSYAYVADQATGLLIIDISNSSNPTLTGNYDTPGYAECVFVSNTYAYVADGQSGLQVINISDPVNPTLAGSYDTQNTAYGVFVYGPYTYVADEITMTILSYAPADTYAGPNQIPVSFSLSQNYPNPFNAETSFEYSVAIRSHVTIEIFNVLGQKVRTLVNKVNLAGSYRIGWNGMDDVNKAVSTGVYLYRYKAGEVVKSKKMLMVK